MNPQSFTRFCDLPLELRHIIWRFSLPTHRRIRPGYKGASEDLPHLIVCHESKAILEATFTRLKSYKTTRHIYFHSETDAIHFALLDSRHNNLRMFYCSPRESKRLTTVYTDQWLEFGVDLWGRLNLLFLYVLSHQPQVRDFLVVVPRRGRKNIKAAQRDEFLHFLKVVSEKWESKEFYLSNLQSQYTGIGKSSVLPAMPRILLDIEDWVIDRDVSEKRRTFDLALIDGNRDEKVPRKWQRWWDC